jgi:transposase
MTKAGNGARRTMAVEMAWGWGRLQPKSALPRWDQSRFCQGRARLRKIGMVALARKLLIALWHFLETGILPAGARLKYDLDVNRIV